MRAIEEHALEERGRGIKRRRVAGAQLAVDLDQRLFWLADRVAAQGVGDDVAHVVALGEEEFERGDAAFDDAVQPLGGELEVGLDDHFSGGGIDHVRGGDCGIELGSFNLNAANFAGAQRLEDAGRDLASGVGHFFTAYHDRVCRLRAEQVGRLGGVAGDGPVQLAVLHRDGVDGVEGLEDLFVGLQAECAQEDRAEELALAVDADVEGVLLVVFELDPRAAVGDDLAEEVGAVVGRLEEDAGRAVQLRNDHALGAVDDEGAVLGHQRNVAEEDFLLLDVADGLGAGLGVLVVDGEAHRHLERGGVGHAALFAFGLVVLQLQTDRVAALVAEVRGVLVVGAAFMAKHIAGMERVGDDHRAAAYAGGAEVMQSLEVTAFALPVADGEIHKVEL